MTRRIVSSLIVSTVLALAVGGAVDLVHALGAQDAPPEQHAIDKVAGSGRSLVDLHQEGEQHPGAPIHQVQVVDLDGPAHRVLVIVDGAAYGTETVARADGGGNPQPPEKPGPPPDPGPDPDPDPAPDGTPPSAMRDAVDVYFRGMAVNYQSVGQQIKEGTVKDLTAYKAATATARNRAANRLERTLADDWGKAEAIAQDGSFLKPDVVGESTITVGRTMEAILGPRK